MKVSDILRVKGTILYTAGPDDEFEVRRRLDGRQGHWLTGGHVHTGDLVGMLTFREVIARIVANGGTLGSSIVRNAMDDAPLTCTGRNRPRRGQAHDVGSPRTATCRSWMRRCLWGVISLYDVAKAGGGQPKL